MGADYVGCKYAVAVSNGTAALYVASSNCILYCGRKPVFEEKISKNV